MRVLGSGGFGQTFVARDTQHPDPDFRCVVKQFRPISHDPALLKVARRLFMNEVSVLRKLGGHDRLPTLLNDFEEDGQFYLVEELIEGRSLSEEFREGVFSEAQVVSLLREVAEILTFVHQANVIHRDIKPSNLIRRSRDQRLVLIDFGAVKELQTQVNPDHELSKLTVGIATEGYGPTEQLAGKPRFNSDLYALGMTGIQALTGLHPSQLPTHPSTGEVIWRDRVHISPWLADILTQLVRYHFNDRIAAATDLLNALDQTALRSATDVQAPVLADLATLMPLEYQEDADALGDTAIAPTKIGTTPRWRNWQTTAIAALGIGLSTAIATGLVATLRHVGWSEPWELAVWDRLIQQSPTRPDPRLLVVGITETDIRTHKKFPLPDGVIAQTIQALQVHNPTAIGLDILRDLPQEPGHAQLRQALQAPNVITILNLEPPITPAPPGVPPDRAGFNDVALDHDSAVRRSLLMANVPESSQTYYSFALQLALTALASQGITLQPSPLDPNTPQLGTTLLHPLDRRAGGYQRLDDQGYQILLRYRGVDAITQVSLGDVLAGKVPPAQIRDRIILIGTTAPNAKDLFLTPYSPQATGTPRQPGVLIHAQMVSQLLDLAHGDESLIWYWADPAELLWIASWALVAAGITAGLGQRPLWLLPALLSLLLALGGSGWLLFRQGGWVPVAAPAIAIVLASVSHRGYRQICDRALVPPTHKTR